jgi:phasin family protein
MSFTEQLSAATASAKSQLENQLDIANHYANTAFEGVQQLIALNFSTTRASVERSSALAKQLLEAKDPRDLIVQTPTLDNMLAYSRELYSIASKTQSELLKLVKEQFQEVTASAAAAAAKPLALVAEVAKQQPAAAQPPAHNEPAESEVADAPASEPTAAFTNAPKAAKPEGKAKPAAKPVAEAIAELAGHEAEEAKPVAADVQEGKPVVLKSVNPKK